MYPACTFTVAGVTAIGAQRVAGYVTFWVALTGVVAAAMSARAVMRTLAAAPATDS